MIKEAEREPAPERIITINDSPVRVKLLNGRTEPLCAYLGPTGTFSQEAATTLIGDQTDFNLKDLNENVVKAVGSGEADIGVVAVENSVDNFVDQSLLELFKNPDLKILGEQILTIHQTLMGRPDAEQVIRSHPKALGQTQRYIKEHYPNAVIVEDKSTSKAVEEAAKNNQIAIGAAAASEIYNLPIIARNIEDVEGNATRFFLIGRGETKPTGHDKTAFLFTLSNKPNSLEKGSHAFASRGLNLEPLYYYPTGNLSEKVFFMTIDAHQEDPIAIDAFAEFDKVGKHSIVGSYKYIEEPKGAYIPMLKERGLV